MDSWIFSVKSSDGIGSYDVKLVLGDSAEVHISCNCKAGLLLQTCRHKDAVVDGDTSALTNSSQLEELKKAGERIRSSTVWLARQEIIESEALLDVLQKKIRKLKKSFAEMIRL